MYLNLVVFVLLLAGIEADGEEKEHQVYGDCRDLSDRCLEFQPLGICQTMNSHLCAFTCGHCAQNPLGQNPLGQNPLGQNPLGQNPLDPNMNNPLNPLGQNPLNPYMNNPLNPLEPYPNVNNPLNPSNPWPNSPYPGPMVPNSQNPLNGPNFPINTGDSHDDLNGEKQDGKKDGEKKKNEKKKNGNKDEEKRIKPMKKLNDPFDSSDSHIPQKRHADPIQPSSQPIKNNQGPWGPTNPFPQPHSSESFESPFDSDFHRSGGGLKLDGNGQFPHDPDRDDPLKPQKPKREQQLQRDPHDMNPTSRVKRSVDDYKGEIPTVFQSNDPFIQKLWTVAKQLKNGHPDGNQDRIPPQPKNRQEERNPRPHGDQAQNPNMKFNDDPNSKLKDYPFEDDPDKYVPRGQGEVLKPDSTLGQGFKKNFPIDPNSERGIKKVRRFTIDRDHLRNKVGIDEDMNRKQLDSDTRDGPFGDELRRLRHHDDLHPKPKPYPSDPWSTEDDFFTSPLPLVGPWGQRNPDDERPIPGHRHPNGEIYPNPPPFPDPNSPYDPNWPHDPNWPNDPTWPNDSLNNKKKLDHPDGPFNGRIPESPLDTQFPDANQKQILKNLDGERAVPKPSMDPNHAEHEPWNEREPVENK